MELEALNPRVVSAGVFEKIFRNEVCRAYHGKLLYILSGGLILTANDERSRLGGGAMIWIPAGTPYSLKGEYISLAAMTVDLGEGNALPEAPVAENAFDPMMLQENAAPFDRVLILEEQEAFESDVQRICDLYTSAAGNYRAIAAAEIKLLLLHLAESTAENALPPSMIRALDAYILEHIGEEITNTEIGAIFGYHPFYVSRLLKEKRGITLRQYVISCRLAAARRALEMSGKSITEIAEDYAFTDSSYFTKVFKSEYGVTPKEYRAAFRERFI